MDVQAYLNRIGFTGAVTLSTDTLIDLARLHMYHVPFENLDIHYQQRIDLKMASLYQKIVVRKRGGFCYELNGLFCELLVQLGFNAHMVSARVFTKAKKYSPEFDHMAIWLVLNDISYLVDVGFGDFIIEPLQIIPALIQSNSSGEFVIDALPENMFRVHKMVAGEKVPQYQFSPDSHPMEDFVPRCIFHQTSPLSDFTKKKLISKALPGGRITMNNTVVKITGNGEKVEKDFEDFQFETKLQLYFGISLE